MLSSADQAALFHSRQRSRGKRNILAGLQRTLFLPPDHGNFDFEQVGDRSRPLTVSFELQITGTPSGLVWQVGSSGVGAGMAFVSGALNGAAGNASGGTGVTVNLSAGAAGAIFSAGSAHQIVWAVNPGTQKMGIWANGVEVIRGQGASAFPSGEHSGAGDGAIAQANGGVTARLGTTASLSGAVIASAVSFFVGQLPRGFEA